MSEPNSPARPIQPFGISRLFDSPRDRVWRAWTTPEGMNGWAPKGTTVEHKEFDLRPGGCLHYCMRAANGHEMWGKWEVREIAEPDRLVFVNTFSDKDGGLTRHPMSASWPLKVLSTVEFKEENGKTRLSIYWLPLDPTEAERKTFDESHPAMTNGWMGTLQQLAEYLGTK